MPLPLFLAIGAAAAGAAGAGASVHGAFKMKKASKIMKEARERNQRNVARFETHNKITSEAMDDLGQMELTTLAQFEKFTALIEQIQNRPEFKKYEKDGVEIPEYDPEELKKVSIGAGVLLGGLGGAAMGTAGGFAAAGAATAAVMALGTASTGTAIASLSGAAATNATLAALGGGAIAAGGGGMALGTTILGVTTLGFGLMVGGLIFSLTGSSISHKAELSMAQVKEAEDEINAICSYLAELRKTADKFKNIFDTVQKVYMRHLQHLDTIINFQKKTEWFEFTEAEKLLIENSVLLTGLLYKMCQVKLVLATEEENKLNEINYGEVEKAENEAKEFLAENDLYGMA